MFTDVTFSVDGRTVNAHRIILASCSNLLLNIFRSIDDTKLPVIIIPGTPFEILLCLLRFLYCGEVFVTERQLPLLLNLAEALGVSSLVCNKQDPSVSILNVMTTVPLKLLLSSITECID